MSLRKSRAGPESKIKAIKQKTSVRGLRKLRGGELFEKRRKPSNPFAYMCQAELDETEGAGLQLYLYSPSSCTKKVSVQPDDQIGSLSTRFFQGKPRLYYFMGQALVESMTFSFYGISKNDRLISVSAESITIDKELYWRTASKNESELKETADLITRPGIKIGLARINDIRMFKAEMKTDSFRRVCRNYQYFSSESHCSAAATNLDYSPKLSDEPIPSLWNSPKQEADEEISLFQPSAAIQPPLISGKPRLCKAGTVSKPL